MKNLGLCPVCGNLIQKYQRIYCSRQCWEQRPRQTGSSNPDWKGGRYIEPGKGYVMIRCPNHPRARQNGYVLEHILVMEKTLGRSLSNQERIHHLNHKPADNRPENLCLYPSNGEHLRDEGHHRIKQPDCRCGRPAIAHGLCSRHYAQLRRTGRTWGFG